MQLINRIEELYSNIETIENYLIEGDDFEKSETVKLIKRGTCFVSYKIGKEVRFAPSRFVGYQNNRLDIHKISETKDGRETNVAISQILKSKPLPNEILEATYKGYCEGLGISPNESGAFGSKRKFWLIEIKNEFENNLLISDEFPEGRLVERSHKARERNSQVINNAKQIFQSKHGSLFCQICGFDFESVYGLLGKGFIEGHHTIAVSDMTPDHKTKVEDIAMVCSNCHRMIHKRRPWLSMNEITMLIKK